MCSDHDALFYGLILFFSLILSLYLYLAPDPGPQTLLSIEIDMADTPSDSGRDIPQPKRHRETPKPCNNIPLRAAPMPATPPALANTPSMDTPDSMPLSSTTSVQATVPTVPGFSATAADAMAGFMTRQDYYELVKMRVEALKKYPAQARKNEVQGEVVVRFELDENGKVLSLSIPKSSGSESLDQAAMRAVQQASPFPHPPSGMFKYPFRLQLAIQFMLT